MTRLTLDVELSYEDDDGEMVEETVAFPAHYEVCGRCDGRGSHVNPAIDGHGLSREDFDEDPDFEEAYFGGVYDVTCYECKGLRVVPVVDEETLPPEFKDKWERYLKWCEDEAAYQRECEMERRMGA